MDQKVNAQFFHANKFISSKKRTYCIFVPNENVLSQSLKENKKIRTMFGIAKVAPGDNYNKTIGRLISRTNVKEIVLEPKLLDFKQSHAEYYVEGTPLIVTFRFNNKSNRVHFISVYNNSYMEY